MKFHIYYIEKFKTGEVNTNTCPTGYQKIVNESDCEAATAYFVNDGYYYNSVGREQWCGALCYVTEDMVELGPPGGVEMRWICKLQEKGAKNYMLCILFSYSY